MTTVTSNSSGGASFSTIALTTANSGQTVTITGITRTDVTPNCTLTPISNNIATLPTVNAPPTTANAGADQTGASTCGLTSVTLAANSPTVGTGAWSIVSGTGGSFGDASSATSTFSGTAGSTYTLRWTISNSPCTASTDDVIITFNQNPVVTANNSCIGGGDVTFTQTGGGAGSWSRLAIMEAVVVGWVNPFGKATLTGTSALVEVTLPMMLPLWSRGQP